jgi:hypothetical protein
MAKVKGSWGSGSWKTTFAQDTSIYLTLGILQHSPLLPVNKNGIVPLGDHFTHPQVRLFRNLMAYHPVILVGDVNTAPFSDPFSNLTRQTVSQQLQIRLRPAKHGFP